MAVPGAAPAEAAQVCASSAASSGSGLISPNRGHAAVSPALHHGLRSRWRHRGRGVLQLLQPTRRRHAVRCQHGHVQAIAGAQHLVRWATSPSGRARRVYSACSGVCASQCSTTACARGPVCASSASQTAVPGAVPASSAARQRSSAASSRTAATTDRPIPPPWLSVATA